MFWRGILSAMLLMGSATAGELSFMAGLAHFNDVRYEHHMPPLYVGTALLGDGVFLPFLRPELELGYWRTDGRKRIPTSMSAGGSLDWELSHTWNRDYHGALVGLKLMIDEGPRAKEKNHKSWPTVGVGISYHWVSEIKCEDARKDHLRGSIFFRANFKAGETRAIFFELEGCDQLDKSILHRYPAVDVICKLGYRFQLF